MSRPYGDDAAPDDPGARGRRREPTSSVRRPQTSTRLTAVEIGRNTLAAAEKELARPSLSLFWSSLGSGLLIGFGFPLGAYLTGIAPPDRAAEVAALVYPIGFILVILARSELFTENTLTPVWAVLQRRDRESVRSTLRIWAILLVGNLAGALAFAAVLAATPMVSPELLPRLDRLAEHAVASGFLTTVYKGVFAGWLIALLTWILAATSATGAQIDLIWLLTWTIAALGFTHSIVGAVEAFYLAIRGLRGWAAMLGDFVLPAAMGNALGGVLLVALLNYGQVAPESDAEGREGEQELEEDLPGD
jgi:formate/nitrite transporter FocA (FNT family)